MLPSVKAVVIFLASLGTGLGFQRPMGVVEALEWVPGFAVCNYGVNTLPAWLCQLSDTHTEAAVCVLKI